MVARDLRPAPSARTARQPSHDEADTAADPLNPVDNTPSELDDLTHAEFGALYRDASANILFSKQQQWRVVLYFSIGAIAVTTYGEMSRWQDPKLASYLLTLIWVFSVISVLIIASLQWWQSAEQQKIHYITSKWSTFAQAARRRKSKLVGDVHRYGMLAAMVLYLELVTIAVTRIFMMHI